MTLMLKKISYSRMMWSDNAVEDKLFQDDVERKCHLYSRSHCISVNADVAVDATVFQLMLTSLSAVMVLQ